MKTCLRLLICLLPFISLTPSHAVVTHTITHGDSLAASCFLALTALEKGLDQIPEDEQTGTFVCMAYLAGVLTTARHANELAKLRITQASKGQISGQDVNLYCFDWNMRYRDAAQIVLQYARQHRELDRQPADKLAMKSLQAAYPCQR